MRKGVLLIATLLLVLALVMSKNTSPAPPKAEKIIVRLYLHQENRVVGLPLEEYVTGVVAAEMPASFDEEALKAQAVAARTFVLRQLENGEQNAKAAQLHPAANICDLPEHGQAWISKEEMARRWGTKNYPANLQKIVRAVQATVGLVLTYQGALITPYYHASCGGAGTESATEIWGKPIAYLPGASCPEDPGEPVNLHQYSFSRGELGKIFGRKDVSAMVLARTSRGRVKSVTVGDKAVSGAELRNILHLSSTRFRIVEGTKQTVRIETLGYGHGVGLCQQGANILAKKGYLFTDILEHYYSEIGWAKISSN